MVAGCIRPQAAESPAPSAGESTDLAASEPASAMPLPSAAAASSEPSATTEPPVAAEGWTMTATFGFDPGSTVATDVAWEGGLVAIGHVRSNSSVVATPSPRIWRSQDGVTWTEEAPDLGVDEVALIGIEVRGDSRFMLVGQTGSPGEPGQGTAAWVSSDGIAWEPIDMPMEGPALAFDRGARGYVVVAGDALWFSPDGWSWSLTADGVIDVAAGDEGFVAVRGPSEEGGGGALASSDGITWIESDDFAAHVMDVVPMDGDWYATGASGDTFDIFVWHSENGLQWTPILNVNDLTPEDGPKTNRGLEYDSISGATLAAGIGRVFITLTGNHCCATLPWSHGVWATENGETWDAVVEGDGLVAGVTGEQELAVLVGYLRRGAEAAFWVLGQ
jgi:hypothetical protein